MTDDCTIAMPFNFNKHKLRKKKEIPPILATYHEAGRNRRRRRREERRHSNKSWAKKDDNTTMNDARAMLDGQIGGTASMQVHRPAAGARICMLPTTVIPERAIFFLQNVIK